jgi:hypothetical protein
MEQKRRQAEMDDERWWKPEAPQAGGSPVTHRLRFMPPPDGFDSWYVEYGVHYRLKGEGDSTVTVTCPLKTLGKPCPVCEFTKGLWKSGAEADQKIAREIGAKTRYASNVVILSKNPGEVKIWSYGTKVWTPLNELCIGDGGEFIPFDDPMTGFNIKIVVSTERTPEGTFPNYTVMPEMKATPLTDRKVLQNIHPIHEMIRSKVKTYDEIRSILLGSGGPVEEAPAQTPAASKAPDAESESTIAPVAEDEEVIEPVKENANAQTAEEKPVSQQARPSTDDLVRKARAAMQKSKS